MKINKIVEKIKEKIPSVNLILNEAMDQIGVNKFPKREIQKNFGDLVRQLESEAFKVYQKYEDLAFRALIKSWKKEKTRIRLKDLEELVKATRFLEFRLGQMRKARGGATFQKIIQKLLILAGIPCEEPHKETRKILRRIDLVVPSAQVAKETPDKAIFLAIKRTLRERWKQVVPEQMKGARLYLVTLNGECSVEKAKEIK